MKIPTWLNQKNIVAVVHSAGALLVAFGFLATSQETQVEQAITVGAGALLSLVGAAHNVYNAILGKPLDDDGEEKKEAGK